MTRPFYGWILLCTLFIIITQIKGQESCHDNMECRYCFNSTGIVFCECKPGFEGDGYSCEDSDECLSEANFCDQNALCINTFGSYQCLCNQGWTGDGRTCTYFDECELGLDDCINGSICVNTDSLKGYKCICRSGLTGDGVSCYDINECEVYPDICPKTSKCQNQYGNYSCVCGHGYEQDQDGRGCKDVDECSMNQNFTYCPPNHSCINKDGGYGCKCLIENCHPDREPSEPKSSSSVEMKHVIIVSVSLVGCVILVISVSFFVKFVRKRYENCHTPSGGCRTSGGRRYRFSDVNSPYVQHINLLEPNGSPASDNTE